MKLIDLNRQFYQTFAVQFSASRLRLQPGVRRLLPELLQAGSILDLGCGNGELARQLGRSQYAGLYVGLDFSLALLEEAQKNPAPALKARFSQADLSQPGWEARLAGESFEAILAFAVLHHLPGAELRRRLLRQVRGMLSQGGLFRHSCWQFLSSPRLKARLQPWHKAGLSETEVDPGDYLLDWKSGGNGLRYIHHFSLEELAELAEEAGFRVSDTFWSDGENGQLGLYQVWKPA